MLRRKSSLEAESAATKALALSAYKKIEHRDYAGAIAQYRLALKGQPKSTLIPVHLSLLLAMCPDSSLRNVPEAIQLMKNLCEMTRYAVPPQVAVLAAVYSEGGRFPEAIEMQQKACFLTSEMPQPALFQKNEALLAWYRAGRPYHEFKAANPSAHPNESGPAP